MAEILGASSALGGDEPNRFGKRLCALRYPAQIRIAGIPGALWTVQCAVIPRKENTMPSLQAALHAALAAGIQPARRPASIKPAATPAAPVPPRLAVRPKVRPAGPRRVPVGTWDDAASRLPVNHGGTFNRESLSKPPQEFEPNFAERYFTKEITK